MPKYGLQFLTSGVFSPYGREMRIPEGWGTSANSARNRHWGGSGGYLNSAGRNYAIEIDQDVECADEILELIKDAELRINSVFSRVNDCGAFNIEEIGCLFQKMIESLPNRVVLERRAGL